MIDGARPWVDLDPSLPNNARGKQRAKEIALERSSIAKTEGLTAADFGLKPRGPKLPPKTDPSGITVSKWFESYFEWREKKPIGGESVADSRGRFKKWIEPRIGPLAMTAIKREHLEDLVTHLDGAAREKRIAPKTAINIFAEARVGFNVATTGKDKGLRVLHENPCRDVAGPDDGTERSKPFLRPDEIVKLLSCEGPDGVPLERRQVYAVAIYTAMRQGELRALRVRDVDMGAMQITVARTMKNGKEKQKTKTGRLRVVQIEPNLVPLLKVLLEGRDGDARVLAVRAHNRCASFLREDLMTAACARDALHANDEMRVHLQFHNLRDTCLTHMAVRRDPPQDIQWRAGHTTPAMTEAYISNARYQVGANFGTPLPPLPACLLVRPDDDETGPDDGDGESSFELSEPAGSTGERAVVAQALAVAEHAHRSIPADNGELVRFRFPAPPPRLIPCFLGDEAFLCPPEDDSEDDSGSSPRRDLGSGGKGVPNVVGLRFSASRMYPSVFS